MVLLIQFYVVGRELSVAAWCLRVVMVVVHVMTEVLVVTEEREEGQVSVALLSQAVRMWQ